MPRSEADRDRVLALTAQGMAQAQIAEVTGMGRPTVRAMQQGRWLAPSDRQPKPKGPRGEGSVFYIPSLKHWAAQIGRGGRRLTAPTEEQARALLDVLRAERDAAAPKCEACHIRPIAPGHSVTCGTPECKVKRKRDRQAVTEAAEAHRWATYAMSVLAAKVGKAGDLDSFPLAWALIAEAEQAVANTVTWLRGHGYSWAEIGSAAGMTKQAVAQWAARHPGDCT